MKLPSINAKIKEVNDITIQLTCPNCGYTDYYNNGTRYKQAFERKRFYHVTCRKCGNDFTYDKKNRALKLGGRRVA